MAFTVTARQSGNSGTTSAQTLTTSSATPSANSLFLVCQGAQMDGVFGVNPAIQTPVGGGYTYNLIGKTGESPIIPWDTANQFGISGAVWRAAVGGSPSAHTVTVDNYSGTTNGYYSAICCDITGHNTASPIVQSKIVGAALGGGNSEDGTVTLDAAPTAGNLLIVWIVVSTDNGGGFADPTAGAGKTMTVVTEQNITFTQGGVWRRVCDGTESATITSTDLGQAVGNYIMAAVEIAPAGAGSTPGGSATGTATWTGSAVGEKDPKGSATGTWTYTGAASGITTRSGSATGTWTYTTGTVEGEREPKGAGSGSWTYTGAADGERSPVATSTGTWTYTGAAVGEAPPQPTGSASGTWTYTGSAVGGAAANQGSGSGTYTFTGAATGERDPVATGSGSWTYTGAAEGERDPLGSAVASWTWTGSAVGTRSPVGSASGVWTYSATAVGGTPPGTGSATGTWTWIGVGVGESLPSEGSASGSWTYTGTATGSNDARDIEISGRLLPRAWSGGLREGQYVGRLRPRAWAGGKP